jgi:hypothetical protein
VSVRRALALVAIGIAGYAVLALLFPRFSSAAQWHVRLGAEDSIVRARNVAAEHGFDVTGWPAEAGVRVDRQLQNELATHGADAADAAQIHIGFRNPRDPETGVGVRLDTGGTPTAIVLQREQQPGDDVTVAAARPIAERAFRGFVADANAYRSVAQEDLGDRGVRFRWERDGETPNVVHRATAIVSGTQVRDLRYGAELREGKGAHNRGGAIDTIDTVSDAAVIFGVLFGLVLYIIAAGRGLVPQRLALALTLLGWLLLLVELFAELDPKIVSIFYTSNASARWTLIFGAAIIGIPTALGLTGGYPSMRRCFPRQLRSFEELLLRDRVISRSVGAALLTGIALGGWIAAVPHLIRATGWFGRYWIDDAPTDPLFRSGLMPTAIYGACVTVLVAFALLASFVQDKIKGRAGYALAFLLAFTVILDDAVGTLAPTLLAGLIVTIILDQLFRRVDLLAVVVAAASGAFVVAAATRIVQPAPSVRADGWAGIALSAIVAAAAFAIALRGSVKPYVPWQPRPARAERERIQAEFDVARLAQERMLPATAPQLPATSIASFCRPAKQVGGDLYDFVTMSDGTVGIAVADVSGKGVPAALVMTITKGLLLAASDGRSDPLETLADVNAGIHSLRNRSVFVTMLFGVFDPVRRTFQFVRAGHTPLIVRRSSGQVETFSPGGLGIGMASSRTFSALCQRATITTTPGDLLILFSDGMSEAMNEHSEEFGEERLLATVRDRVTNAMSAEEVRVVLVDAVDQFRGGAAAHDDMTLVVVKT